MRRPGYLAALADAARPSAAMHPDAAPSLHPARRLFPDEPAFAPEPSPTFADRHPDTPNPARPGRAAAAPVPLEPSSRQGRRQAETRGASPQPETREASPQPQAQAPGREEQPPLDAPGRPDQPLPPASRPRVESLPIPPTRARGVTDRRDIPPAAAPAPRQHDPAAPLAGLIPPGALTGPAPAPMSAAIATPPHPAIPTKLVATSEPRASTRPSEPPTAPLAPAPPLRHSAGPAAATPPQSGADLDVPRTRERARRSGTAARPPQLHIGTIEVTVVPPPAVPPPVPEPAPTARQPAIRLGERAPHRNRWFGLAQR
jgi:hypothetical protein